MERKYYNKIRADQDAFQRELYKRTAELERAKVNNERREQLLAEAAELDEFIKELTAYSYDLKRLLASLQTEDRAFKNRRIGYLNALITDSLAEIFPDDGLQAKLYCDFNRKSEVVLELYDHNGNVLIPEMCSGKLQQYLISFAAISGISKGLGVNNLYVDEAFGVAAPGILGEIGKVIQRRVEQGVQIVMIAQNPGLYQDLPRREITLQKDYATESVVVVSELDY